MRDERFEALCEELAEIVDGDPAALARHAETLADDDEARDLRHDAERVVHDLRALGATYEEPPASRLAERVRTAIDVRGLAPLPGASTVEQRRAPDRSEPPGRSPASAPRGESPPSHGSERQGAAAAALARSKRARLIVLGVVGALAAAAAVVVAVKSGSDRGAATAAGGAAHRAGWSGRLDEIVRAAAPGGPSGVSVRLAGRDAWQPATPGAAVALGGAVRTDARTRARLSLSDGTTVTLDHETELSLDAGSARHARLTRGSLLAEVRPASEVGAPAVIDVPHGTVTVLGTRLAVTVGPDQTAVRVVYGHARVSDAAGHTADVKTGMEGTIGRAGVAAGQATSLAEATEWAELPATIDGAPEVAVHGLGELRARRPGARTDAEQALRLASHRVTVRIQGTVARTEIEEEFANDSPQQLEGTYRFPLPPDAQIARLALYVGDRVEEGAFVDRDRAANIWRGVIRQSTPTAQRQQHEEYVWVPGPWEDPALLEWQRGGRFELRIFPIPARGSRKVILAYTQVLSPQSDGMRRYVYPLPHDPGGTTRADRFVMDVRVSGHDPDAPVRARGYAMTQSNDRGTTTLATTQTSFVPAGDLVVEYALPRRDAALRAFAYAPPSGLAAAAPGAAAPTPARGAGTPARAPESAALAAAREADRSSPGFALLAIRPALPPWRDARPRDYALAVDVSHSMRGERMARAIALLSEVVSTMDRRDRFTVLACDVACRTLAGGLRSPSTAVAGEARAFLESIEAGNASDPVAAVRAAAAAIASSRGADRDGRIVLLSDGHATAGWRQPGNVAFAAGDALDARTTLTTVGIGSDSDEQVMRALARAGGGRFVPYVPGQRVSGAAIAVLESTYGTLLREARLELPPGMTQVAPAVLPTLRAGDELLVVARTSGDVRGEARLTGKVGDTDWSDRYPVEVRMTSNEGNAFVPRLWAAARIADLDADGGASHREEIAYLSERFGVLSRYTSLLVLESPAMFRAFRVARVAPLADWSGETAAEVSESRGLEPRGAADVTADDDGDGESERQAGQGEDLDRAREVFQQGMVLHGDRGGRGRGDVVPGRGRRPVTVRGTPTRAPAPSPDPRPPPRPAEPAPEPPDAQRTQAPNEATVAARETVTVPMVLDNRSQPRSPVATARITPRPNVGGGEPAAGTWFPRPTPRPGSLAPRRRSGTWMRRVTVRVGAVESGSAPGRSERDAVERARRSLALAEDSRDRHRSLVRALSIAGDVDEAAVVATRWWERDRLDAEALARLADAEARRGHRDRAIRLAASTLDVRGDDVALHERMARLYERVGRGDEACAHRVALAELQGARAEALGAALRCLRALGRTSEATHLETTIADATTRARADELAARPLLSNDRVRGDVVAEASWDAPVDLDVSIITPRGTRASWMGGPGAVTARDAASSSGEAVGVARMGTGRYVVEIVRPDSEAPPIAIHGRVTIRALGERRTVPFTLDGQRLVVGRGVIRTETRTVRATW